MRSKEKILAKLKGNKPPICELPDLHIVDSWGGEIDIDNLKQKLETLKFSEFESIWNGEIDV